MPYVYMLRCCDGSLYTGAAKNVDRRVVEHQAGTASKYTRSRRPLTLAWFHLTRTWGRALQLERRIKQLPRSQKLALLAAGAAGRSRMLKRLGR